MRHTSIETYRDPSALRRVARAYERHLVIRDALSAALRFGALAASLVLVDAIMRWALS